MKEINRNIGKTLTKIKEYCSEIVFNPVFYVPFIISILISYSFTLVNRTIFIDDLAQQVYYGATRIKIRSLRWGQAFTGALFSTVRHTPFINKLLGLMFLILTAIVIGTTLYNLDQKKNNIWKYSLFSCFIISYPLITEFFGYFEALIIPFQFLLVAYSVFYQLIKKENNKKDYIFIGLLLSIVIAGYESIAVAYISEVILVLFIQYVINDKEDNRISLWIKEGFMFAIPLVIALVIKFLVGYPLVFITDRMNMINNGGRAIYWSLSNIKEPISHILMNGYLYFVRGLSFFPITEFAISLILFIVFAIIKQKNKNSSLILAILYVLSIFTLSFLQGDILPYRTAQSAHLLVAFVVYLLCEEIQNGKLYKYLLVALLFVCFRQSVYTHQLFALDNQRSNNETELMRSIGRELYTEYDLEKPVVFCGKYHLGDNINNQITVKEGSIEDWLIKNYIGENNRRINRRITDRNVTSVINWAIRAFGDQNMIKEYLSYCGYDINITNEPFDQNTSDKYELVAIDNGMKPHSIKDMGDYILVYMGKID